MDINSINENSQEKFVVLMKCHDCGEELNRSIEMTGEALHKKWVMIVASGPLNSKACPKGCRATYSDCNANIDFDIIKSDQSLVIGG